MGLRNFGSLLIVFLIIMLLFGTQRLRDIGNDLAVAIRNFRKGLQEDQDEQKASANTNTHLSLDTPKETTSETK